MKRDMDLVRKLLRAIEESETPARSPDLHIEGFTDDQVGYHLMIMGEAELVTGGDVTPNDSEYPVWIGLRLTWKGHEFIDAANDDSVWAKVKGAAKGLPMAVAMPLLKAYLIHEGKRVLHLPE